MARKKAVSSSGNKSVTTSQGKTQSKSQGKSQGKSPAKDGTAQSSNGKKVAPKKREATAAAPRKKSAFSNEDIGHTAGEIWRRLTEQNGQSLASLKKSIDAPSDLVLTAVGWLAREDKLDFATSGRSVKVSLR